MINELSGFLEDRGFEKIVTNLPEFVFFYKQEMQGVNVLFLLDYHKNVYLTNDQYEHLKDGIRNMFMQRGAKEIHILSLIIATDKEKVLSVCGEDRFCWQIEPELRRVIIYEHQVPDFYGMKEMLEQFLSENTGALYEGAGKEGIETGRIQPENDKLRVQWRKLPVVTISLVAVNVILYLLCTQYGNLLYNIGDLSGTAVYGKHEYYRIFTSMFLHAGVDHLFSNMIVLYFLGEIIEREYGHIRYTILYFGAGIIAAGASIASQYLMADFTGSVGASGAIYGLLGALLWLLLTHRGHYREVTLPRLLFYLAYSFYSGFQGTNIDNAAHIGGLIGGFIISIFLRGRSRRNED